MMKGLAIQQNPVVLEENTSNLTSASGEASVSSGSRAENENNMYQQSLEYSTNPLPPKKKRNLPGNPDPEAEVIALSPKTLMATNRFVCEICSKGFQRDQNLQLHRRGHNLPWKLKQRTSKEVRKRVYICPEPSCVHHEASRALGDLTGIKKHFCRKHGEKKWKCDKCSKRYAVQSDWKAHSKVCGTREYRCDCGTLFSRRDSFITHRAFCDALAEESSRSAMTTKPPTYPLLLSQANSSSSTHMINLQSPFPDILGASQNNSSSSSSSIFNTQKEQQQHFNLKSDIPPWLSCTPVVSTASLGSPTQAPTSVNHLDLSSSIFSTRLAHEFSQSQAQVPHENVHLPPPFHAPASSPHMSATALLQKAAKMGATMSKPGFALNLSSSREVMESGFVQGLTAFGNKAAGLMQQTTAAPSLLHSMMGSSLSSAAGLEGSFGEAFGGILGDPNREGNHLLENLSTTHKKNEEGGGNDGLSTRDFLGLRAFSHKDMIFNIAAGLDNPCMDSSSYGQIHNQKPWQG